MTANKLPHRAPDEFCAKCLRVFNPTTDKRYGPDMWVDDHFTCRHERPSYCPACRHDNWHRFRVCRYCGTDEVYC